MNNEAIEQEIERLAAVLIPYLCERTGLSRAHVEQVMNAQEDFWNTQRHVIGRLFVLGFEVDGNED